MILPRMGRNRRREINGLWIAEHYKKRTGTEAIGAFNAGDATKTRRGGTAAATVDENLLAPFF